MRFRKLLAVLSRCLAVVVVILAVGCSSSRVFQTVGPDTPAGAVSDVKITVQPGSLSRDREARYRSVAMSGAIRSALLKELRGKNKVAASGATLEFVVTDFRLRSGSQVFWIGIAAGSDYLAGTVTVRQGDDVLKAFEASAKGYDSLWSGIALWRLPAGRRADRFARMIARKIADQL